MSQYCCLHVNTGHSCLCFKSQHYLSGDSDGILWRWDSMKGWDFPTGTLVKWHYKCRPLSPSFLFLSVDLFKSTSSSACAQRYLGPLGVHLVSRVLPSRTSWISLASSVSYMSRASARFLCSLAWDFSRALARSYDSWREQEKRCQRT